MISIRNLTYGYKKGKDILKDINLEIKDGETIVIMGRNGSGKSTLGKLISGIIKPKKDSIIIDNLDIAENRNKEQIRNNIGIVFQNPENQIIFNNIEDELSFSLKELDNEEKKRRIEYSLKSVYMEDKRNEDLYEMSLGQKQRIVISEVLAKKPKYIVFDEPTSMIDSNGKEKIYNIVKDLKKEGYTIIYITNIAEEIFLADRIVIIEDGKIAEILTKKELFDKLEVLKKYNIKVPILLELVQALREDGINLQLKEYSQLEIINKIKELVKNEK